MAQNGWVIGRRLQRIGLGVAAPYSQCKTEAIGMIAVHGGARRCGIGWFTEPSIGYGLEVGATYGSW